MIDPPVDPSSFLTIERAKQLLGISRNAIRTGHEIVGYEPDGTRVRTLLETIEGTLVHAELDKVQLDRVPLDGAVLLTVGAEVVKLSLEQTHQLAIALTCALTPYGWKP